MVNLNRNFQSDIFYLDNLDNYTASACLLVYGLTLFSRKIIKFSSIIWYIKT